MPVPRPCLVTDMCVQTPWSLRRSRFYWNLTVAPTGITQIEACCNRLMAVYGTLFANLMTMQVSIVRFEGRWFGPGTQGFEGNSTVGAIQGANTAATPGLDDPPETDVQPDTLPDEVCLIVQKRTGNTSRSKNGRWFFSGLTEKIQNAGLIEPEWIGTCTTLANALSTDVTVSSGFSTVMNARHWDQKNSDLLPITKCYALRVMGTRRDRRNPLKLERL